MGLLSISVVLVSLLCLAALMGLVLAAIFLWPHDRRNDPDGQPDDPGPSDQMPSE